MFQEVNGLYKMEDTIERPVFKTSFSEGEVRPKFDRGFIFKSEDERMADLGDSWLSEVKSAEESKKPKFYLEKDKDKIEECVGNGNMTREEARTGSNDVTSVFITEKFFKEHPEYKEIKSNGNMLYKGKETRLYNARSTVPLIEWFALLGKIKMDESGTYYTDFNNQENIDEYNKIVEDINNDKDDGILAYIDIAYEICMNFFERFGNKFTYLSTEDLIFLFQNVDMTGYGSVWTAISDLVSSNVGIFDMNNTKHRIFLLGAEYIRNSAFLLMDVGTETLKKCKGRLFYIQKMLKTEGIDLDNQPGSITKEQRENYSASARRRGLDLGPHYDNDTMDSYYLRGMLNGMTKLYPEANRLYRAHYVTPSYKEFFEKFLDYIDFVINNVQNDGIDNRDKEISALSELIKFSNIISNIDPETELCYKVGAMALERLERLADKVELNDWNMVD